MSYLFHQLDKLVTLSGFILCKRQYMVLQAAPGKCWHKCFSNSFLSSDWNAQAEQE